MPTFNQQGSISEVFVSSLSIHDRAFYKELFQRDPERSFFTILRDMMTSQPVDQPEYEHAEDGSLFQGNTFAVDSIPTAPGGGAVRFKLPASVTKNGVGAQLVGQLIEFNLGTPKQGRISLVEKVGNDAFITVTPYTDNGLGALDTLVGAVVSGTNAWVFSNAHAAGKGQPKGVRRSVDKFKNITQIFKNSLTVEGSEESSTLVFNIGGKPAYAVMGEEDLADLHMFQVDMGLFFGQGSLLTATATAVDEDGDPLRVTKGVYHTAKERGINRLLPTSAGGQLLIDGTEIDEWIRRLNKRRAPAEYMFLNGLNVELALDNYMQGQKSYEGIQYTGIGGKQNAEALGFQSYRKSSYSFHAQRMDLFNHDQLAGSNGSKYPSTCFGVPLHKVKDPATGKDSTAISLMYKQGNGINRYNTVWETGANARQNKNEIDERRIHYRTECGSRVMGADLLFIGQPA